MADQPQGQHVSPAQQEGVQQIHKVVGFFQQTWIIVWKNFLLFRRNLSGMFVEIFVSYVFLAILVFLRYFIDVTQVPDQDWPALSPIAMMTINSNRPNLYYYPNTTLIQTVADRAVNGIKLFFAFQNITFNASVIASPYSAATSMNYLDVTQMFAFFAFPSNYTSSFPNDVQYTIYTQERSGVSTNGYQLESDFVSPSAYQFTDSPESFCSGGLRMYNQNFDPVKYAMDMAIIGVVSGKPIMNPNQVQIAQYNCEGYTNDIFKSRFSFFPVVLICMSYMFTLIVTVNAIITEKQTKMKEYLKLMGIKWYVIWITWFIRSFIPYLILDIIVTALCTTKLQPRLTGIAKAVFINTDSFTAFSVFFVYSVQVSMFTILLGQIFSNSFIGKTIAILIWLGTSINFFTTSKTAIRYLACIFPNCGLVLAINVIFQYERSSISFAYGQLYNNIFNDTLNVGGVLTAQILWTLFYIPVAWYIERIFPGDYGAPQPFYFPFQPSYWLGSKSKVSASDAGIEIGQLENNKFGFEKDPKNLKATISIQEMTKKFKIGLGFKEKTVVDKMNINFYENQITGLLGHNGAGKTTTTFMLCGIYAPTSGDAFVFGKSIKNQMSEIRKSLGFCPQHDILFDELTVAEHIDLIAQIKGYSRKEIKQEIQEISTFVGLQNDLEKKSKQLSGGMKRRLSVAMALTGGSKIIILDEPTSGLDPYNRRTLWELISKFKHGRSIILTTHFMEEADALSDRIAIMNHGQVKCCGSPHFLKNTFGSGHRLTLSKGLKFDEPLFKAQLTSMVSKFMIETNIAAEMCINIPFEESPKLPTLLTNIEQNKAQYGIDGYGISSPTIEEVFIKVGSIDVKDMPIEENNKNTNIDKQPNEIKPTDVNNGLQYNENDLSSAFSSEFTKNTGLVFWFEQLLSLWIKRWKIFYRRYILAAFTILGPIILQALFCSLIGSGTLQTTTSATSVGLKGTYNLGLSTYPSNTIPYYVNGTVSTSSFQSFLSSVYTSSNRPGVTLQNMSTSDLNTYVLNLRKSSIMNLLNTYYFGMSFYLQSSTNLQATVYYNSMALQSAGNILNEVDNLIFQVAMGGSTGYSISTTNAALRQNTSTSGFSGFINVLPCFNSLPYTLLSFFDSVIVAFMIAIVTMNMSRERLNGSKQLQLLSGTDYYTYWLSNYLIDWPVFVFNIVSLLVVLLIVNSAKNDVTNELYGIAGNSNATCFYFLVLLISSLAWCPYAYLWSFLFKSDIVGFVFLVILLGFLAFLDMILTFVVILMVNGSGSPAGGSRLVGMLRSLLALVFPNITVQRALFNIKVQPDGYCIDANNLYLATSWNYNQDLLSMQEPGLGLMFVYSVIQFIVANLVLILIETRILKRCTCAGEIDLPIEQLEQDVAIESDRITASDLTKLTEEEPLVVNNLVKQFKKGKKEFVAVNNLSFGVAKKECFGFLGMNGAGKTTTFKILTGELKATSGQAYVNGCDISKKMLEARRSLAFCPQFDYLPEYMTVRDTLLLFSGIRGLESKTINNVINDLMAVFKITEFQDKLVQNLSGGNKRKVSSAISFIGRPKVVFLDEPTTGMDPAARRYLWTVIKKARDSGMTIVLTTHSMEECEALSSKLGIMVNGQFKCFGSVQHLKDKFGKGYTLILKLENHVDHSDIAEVEQFVQSQIRFSVLTDKQQETLFYKIEFDRNLVNPQEIQTIAELFTLIEANKERLQLETYSLSQTSLEQVFLSFARHQNYENGSPAQQ